MARQVLRITKEATVGTFDGSATSGNITIIRLTEDNAFAGRPMPNRYTVRDAGSSNRLVQTGLGTYGLTAKLTTPLYLSQAALLLPWACNIVTDGAGGFKPAYSVTIDFLAQIDGTSPSLWYQRYLGCYCSNYTLSANSQGEGVKAMQSFDISYLDYSESITATDLPMPGLADYPDDEPVIHQMLCANKFILGAARTDIASFSIGVAHMLDPVYEACPKPSIIHWGGRDVTGQADLRFLSAVQRNAYLGVTAQSASYQFTDGTTTATFDMQDFNYVTTVNDKLPLRGVHRQDVSFSAYLDVAGGTDLAVTVA